MRNDGKSGKGRGFLTNCRWISVFIAALAFRLAAHQNPIQPTETYPFIPYIFGGALDADNRRCDPENPNSSSRGCPAVVYSTEMEVYNTDPEGNPARYQIRFQYPLSVSRGRGRRVGVRATRNGLRVRVDNWVEGVVSPGEVHFYKIRFTSSESSASLVQGEGLVEVNTTIRIQYGEGMETLAKIPLVSQRSMVTRMPFKNGDLEKTALLLSTAPDYLFSNVTSRGYSDDLWLRPVRIAAYDKGGNILCDHWIIENLHLPKPQLFFIDDDRRLACLAGKETEGLLEISRSTPYMTVVGRRVRLLDLSSAGVDAKLPLSFLNMDGYRKKFEPTDPKEPQTIPTPKGLMVEQSEYSRGGLGRPIIIRWNRWSSTPLFSWAQVRDRIDGGVWQAIRLSSDQTTLYPRQSSAAYEYQVRYLDCQNRFGDWSQLLMFSVRNGVLDRNTIVLR